MQRCELNRRISLVILSVAVTGAAYGQSSGVTHDEDPVAAQLRQMQDDMRQLRQENSEMRGEIDELRAGADGNWLTERRSEEIREIVYDVLADADTRASMLQSGLTAGWRDHFFLASTDGRFKLEIGGQMQVRYMYNHQGNGSSSGPDHDRYGFENTRTKFTFGGHVFDPDLTFFIENAVTREEPGLVDGIHNLEDAWLRKQFTETFSVRAGQFKLPFNREELVYSGRQLAVERSLVNQSLNIGRSQGIELTWAGQQHKFSIAYHDGGSDTLGGFNVIGGGTMDPTPNPTNNAALVEDTEWAFAMRYEWLVAGNWRQFDDFTSPIGEEFGLLIGVAAHGQQDERDRAFTFSRNERRWYGYTVDASAEFGGASLFGSFTHQYVDNPNIGIFNFYGIVVQGGVYLTPKWEMFGRAEWGQADQDTALDDQDLWLGTIGVNYYIDGHDLKWTTDVGYAFNEISTWWDSGLAGWNQDPDSAKAQVVFRTQFQLLF